MNSQNIEPVLTKNKIFNSVDLSVWLILLVLLALDLYFFKTNQQLESFISLFGFAVFLAQIVFAIIFFQGQICNGQRKNLLKVNRSLAGFWLLYLVLNIALGNHYTPIILFNLIAFIFTLILQAQAKALGKDDVSEYTIDQKAVFNLLLAIAILAGLAYLISVINLLAVGLVQYNPFIAPVIAMTFAVLMLKIARNRLDNFRVILNFIQIIALLVNALVSLVVVFIAYRSGNISAVSIGYILYFVIHLILAAIVSYGFIASKKLNLAIMLFVFLLSLCLVFTLCV